MPSHLSLLRTRGVTAFLTGQFLALFSGLFGLSVLTWLVVSKFDASGIAQFYAVQSLISFVSYVALSPLGDRYRKLTVVKLASNLVAVRSVLLTLLVAYGDAPLAAIVALQAINAIAMSVVVPSRASLLPELVSPAQLQSAYGVQQSVSSLGRTLGPACAGFALIALPVSVCLAIHAAMMVVVCVLNQFVRHGDESRQMNEASPSIAAWGKDILDGWRLRLRIPIERASAVLAIPFLMAYLPATTMLVPLRVQEAGWGTHVFGITEGCLSAGALLAGLGGASALTRRFSRFAMYMTLQGGAGVAMLVASLTPRPVVFAGAYLLVGFCATAAGLLLAAQRMLAAPKDYRARLSASGMTLAMIAGSAGAYLCGLALMHTSLGTVHIGLSTLVILLTLPYLAIPRFREFLNLPPEAAQQWYERAFLREPPKTSCPTSPNTL